MLDVRKRRSTNHIDERGSLYALECGKEIPFPVRRTYFICGVSDATVVRGYHAHKTLHQIMLCLGGSCDIILDDGTDRITVTLSDPGEYIYVPPGLWREMTNFSQNATLMVIASEVYGESDYIRDYETFKKLTNGE